MKQRNHEVKERERAHSAASGGIWGQPNYKYVTGLNGKRYTIAGEVRINTTPVRGNPDGTIRELDQVKRAALVPREPLGQCRHVSISADEGIATARQVVSEKKREEIQVNEGHRVDGEAEAASRAFWTAKSGDSAFDSEECFCCEVGGVSEPSQTRIAGAGVLQTTGLSNRGCLFSLIT